MTNFAGIRADISRVRSLMLQLPSETDSECALRDCLRSIEQALEGLTRSVYDLKQAAERDRKNR